MIRLMISLVVILSSSLALSAPQCVPPEQLVFKWEYRNIWTCDTRVETYEVETTICEYNGILSLSGNPEGDPEQSIFAATTKVYSGNIQCPANAWHTESRIYWYTDSQGNLRTGTAFYDGSLFFTGQRSV
ncbi:MAG: hypothetical protein V2I33_14940, partial [Kangiellaceae bacterium]|nr:hypothetical protein [Kangiellaceae bacterium]